MVEFAGYEMPLSYEGKVGENIAGGPGEFSFELSSLNYIESFMNSFELVCERRREGRR